MRSTLILSLATLLISGCVHYRELRPAPGASLVPGKTGTVVQDAAGVHTTVAVNSWSGYPSSLNEVMTPVFVTMENHSGHSLRVQYQNFHLVGDSGFRYAALPPFSLRSDPGSGANPNQKPQNPAPPAAPDQNPSKSPEPNESPNTIQKSNPPNAFNDSTQLMPAFELASASERWPSDWESDASAPGQVVHAFAVGASTEVELARNFGVAAQPHAAAPARPHFSHPHHYSGGHYFHPGHAYARFYWGYPYWYWGWGPYRYWYDPYPYGWYPYYYGYWTVPLPSQDMMERAMPEGLVDDGGQISGFVYFQNVASRERHVSFEMVLIDSQSGQAFGWVSIPFDVQ